MVIVEKRIFFQGAEDWIGANSISLMDIESLCLPFTLKFLNI